MNSASRTCQNCKSSFLIEPEDVDFYRKIEVPPPTFCPECRMRRRFAWRNERTLFRNKCAATGKDLIAGFHPSSGITVYDRDYWWSDDWDPLQFGQDYDLEQPFFAQFRKLLELVPMPAVFNARTTNTLYANYAGEYKDGYMVSASWSGENVAYASRANSTKDSLDLFAVVDCNFCYQVVTSEKMYRCYFCQDSESCTDSWFLYGCKGCTNCFGCTNLRGKSYYIFNEPHSKEEYLAKLKELNLGSYPGFQAARQKFEAIKNAALRKYANNINCVNVSGDHLSNAANCRNCFDTFGGVKDCKYLINSLDMNDCYDGYGVGAKMELSYEAFDSGVQGLKQCFVGTIYGGANIFYSFNCHGCSNLFGCIGLRNKEYCIFNRQYSKEDFTALRARIVRQMADQPYVDKKGRRYAYGEYFPIELSPFAYNESVAQEYFPLTAESAAAEGYLWREPEKSAHTITCQAADLPDNIAAAKDDILQQVLGCENCGKAYRLIASELQFLKHAVLPLPRQCPECRHRARFLQVNFPRLYQRQCMCNSVPLLGKEGLGEVVKYQNISEHFHGIGACPNKFETTYPPDRPETVYCESCYNAEVV